MPDLIKITYLELKEPSFKSDNDENDGSFDFIYFFWI